MLYRHEPAHRPTDPADTAPARSRRRSRGQSVTELALILPLFLFLFAMAADFGRLFYAWVAVVNAAKEGAAYGAMNPVCTDDSRAMCSGTRNVEWRVANETELPVAATLIECRDKVSGAINIFSLCDNGDTYVVEASHTFNLVTPILSQVIGDAIVLRQQARATVINDAFDPNPGIEIKKLACGGAACTPTETPILDADMNLVYAEVQSGDPITYLLRVTNIGGPTLSGVTVSDSAGSLPTGTLDCPSVPSSMTSGQVWTCTYTRTAPNPGGPPDMLVTNTATVDTTQLDPVQGQATVKVIAAPAELVVSKTTHVYRLGGNGAGLLFGNADTWNPQRNSQVSSVVMWFRIIVTNPGGQDATNFALTDGSGSLPTNTDCPARPSTLGPGASYVCFFSRTFGASGVTSDAATATADGLSDSDTTTITVDQCASPSLVIPKLVGIDGRTNVVDAWTAAGFPSGQLTTWGGSPNQTAATQSVFAYSCVASSQTMTVSP